MSPTNHHQADGRYFLVSAVTRATTLTALHDVAEDVAALDLTAPVDVRSAAVARSSERTRAVPPHFSIQIFSELGAVEAEWRQFERTADCTAFQTFDWLATWQKHVGERRGARPVIAVGRFAEGDIAFIVPLCLMRGHLARRLCWLGQDLCDYNAPLLAADFSERTTPEDFLAAWHELQVQMQCEPLLRHDWIEFEKMPETVGAQANPFMHLRVTPNRSNAHLAHLGEDWEKFYCAKRSSATRRRDRSKLRHMSQFGDVRFITAADARRRAPHARNPDGAKKPRTHPQRRRRYLCSAGTSRVFPGPRRQSEDAPSGACQPNRDRRHLRRDQFRHRVRRLLLSRARELRGQRGRPLWTGRAASARASGLRHQTRPQVLRFHHRRRAIQVRLVRHRPQAVRLYGDDEVARPAGARLVERATAQQAADQTDAAIVEYRLACAQRRSRRSPACRGTRPMWPRQRARLGHRPRRPA